MFVRNTSQYPTEEIKRLLAVAAQGYDLRYVCVNVKGSRGSYAGRAYSSVPGVSNAPRSSRYLVVIRIGSPEKFPCNNLHESVRWQRLPKGEPYRVCDVRSVVKTRSGVQEAWLEKRIVTKHPYGGKGSPLLEYRNWREGFVAVAAHEFNHINQYQNRLRRSEVACERKAAAALERFRRIEAGLPPEEEL